MGGSLKCDIAKVRRQPHILNDGEELMLLHTKSGTKLEVQFKEESGFGDGVTQGFYTDVCNCLQSSEENKSIGMWSSGTGGKQGARGPGNRYGLFPASWPPKNSVTYSHKQLQERRRVLQRFRFLGRLMGTALRDGFICPLPLSVEFFDCVLG